MCANVYVVCVCVCVWCVCVYVCVCASVYVVCVCVCACVCLYVFVLTLSRWCSVNVCGCPAVTRMQCVGLCAHMHTCILLYRCVGGRMEQDAPPSICANSVPCFPTPNGLYQFQHTKLPMK